MYSFRLLENVPLRLVNAVGPGLRELSLDALVLFRPSCLCASCTSHRGPIVPKLACSNLRPASPAGAWSLRKVPRKVPRSRTTWPSRSVSRKRRCLRVMGPLTAMKCPSSEHDGAHTALQRYLGQDVVPQIAQHAAGVGQLGAAQVDLIVAVHAHEFEDLLPTGDEAGA